LTKLLLVVAVTVAVVFWLRHLGRDRRDRRDRADSPAGIEDMTRCKLCGVHLPRSEAIQSQGQTYCCDEHRRRDQG